MVPFDNNTTQEQTTTVPQDITTTVPMTTTIPQDLVEDNTPVGLGNSKGYPTASVSDSYYDSVEYREKQFLIQLLDVLGRCGNIAFNENREKVSNAVGKIADYLTKDI